MNKLKRNIIITALLFAMFVVFTVLVATVDLQPVGPENSTVGFATVNKGTFNALGSSELWDKITDLIGLAGIAIIGIMGLYGFVQLVKRKSLFKVDAGILALAAFYVIVVAAYVLFEIVVINCRPVLVDGVLEASYPSSHTMLVICSMASAMVVVGRKLTNNKPLKNTLYVILTVLMIAMTAGRLLSGMHWLTDIIGGVLLALSLVMTYVTAVSLIDKKTEGSK
jgi:undecaprenyl-diphosphatase